MDSCIWTTTTKISMRTRTMMQNYKSFECKLCKTTFKTRNMLVKHLNDVDYHKVTIPNTKKRGAPDVPLAKSSKRWLESVVYIGTEEYNKVEAFAVHARRITSHNNRKFAKICKLHKLEASLHGKYRYWPLSEVTFGDGRPISPDDIPLARGMAVRPGMNFPYPSGTKSKMFTGIKTKYLNPTFHYKHTSMLSSGRVDMRMHIRNMQ